MSSRDGRMSRRETGSVGGPRDCGSGRRKRERGYGHCLKRRLYMAGDPEESTTPERMQSRIRWGCGTERSVINVSTIARWRCV